MINMTLSGITKVLQGELFGTDRMVNEVITDSRKLSESEDNSNRLFIALKGPHFDAHQFLTTLPKNLGGVVVDHQCEIDIPQVIVTSTHKALAELARHNRMQSNAKVVAITGSSGKTTVKEMIAAVLTLAGKTLATEGNFNNDIGAPLTLLRIEQEHQFAVIELGANHEGEIAFTSDITQPDVAMVNNVSEAHLEGFGDIQGVARAKSEIYYSLSKDGIAIVNQDEPFAEFFMQRIECPMLRFSINQNADVYADNIVIEENQAPSFDLHYGEKLKHVELSVVGIHNVANAVAAASCCIALGITLDIIVEGLRKASPVPGRLVVNTLPNGCKVIDDSYNANVSSMKAAIDLLGQFPGKRILVAGDMGELGEQARECHEQIGAYAKQVGIEKLFSVGVLTQFTQRGFHSSDSKERTEAERHTINQTHFSQQAELIKTLKKEAKKGVTILVKGSRSAHMENIVKALEESTFDSCNEDQLKGSQSIASLMGDQ